MAPGTAECWYCKALISRASRRRSRRHPGGCRSFASSVRHQYRVSQHPCASAGGSTCCACWALRRWPAPFLFSSTNRHLKEQTHRAAGRHGVLRGARGAQLLPQPDLSPPGPLSVVAAYQAEPQVRAGVERSDCPGCDLPRLLNLTLLTSASPHTTHTHPHHHTLTHSHHNTPQHHTHSHSHTPLYTTHTHTPHTAHRTLHTTHHTPHTTHHTHHTPHTTHRHHPHCDHHSSSSIR